MPNAIQTKLTDYDGFVDKFVPKKTTDDCYTPQAVYDEVLKFVGELTDLTGREIVRPFWPGGDFERFDYPKGCIVVDNPPFSIYAKIVRFYLANHIDFFLFAPALTQTVMNAEVCYVICMAEVTYQNGAVVRTSFTTNLVPDKRIMVSGSLYRRIVDVQVNDTKQLTKFEYPDNLITCATMGKIAARGVDFEVPSASCAYVRRLDNMPGKNGLFGAGFLLSDRATAVKLDAERRAREIKELGGVDSSSVVIGLSEREKAVVDIINRQECRQDAQTAKCNEK